VTMRLAGPVLTAGACAAVWYGYENLALLRGSVLWDLRYVVLGVAAVLALGLAQWIAALLARRFPATAREE